MRINEKRILTTAPLTLSKNIKQGKPRGTKLILKHVPRQTYLTIDKEQWKILRHFKQPASVGEIVPGLIMSRTCPPLRTFYELILKAVEAHVLVEREEGETIVRAADWKGFLGRGFSHVIGVALILFGVFSLLLKRGGETLLLQPMELLLGLGIISLGLSLGYALAASLIRGFDCEVYRPRFHWKTLIPHFRVDIEDSQMGGSDCGRGVALLLMGPLFLFAGLCAFWYPNLKYMMVLGLFFVTQPFRNSPATLFLAALYREMRLSTTHDFLFVQNRLLWTVLNAKIKFADKKYLLIYAFYTLIWLSLVFAINVRVFNLNATALLTEFYHSGQLKLLGLILLGIVASLILCTAFIGLWILLKNFSRHFLERVHSRKNRVQYVAAKDFPRHAIMKALSQSDLFGECKEETLLKIAEEMKVMEVRAGAFIIKEGETGNTFFHLLSGKVEVVRELPSGRFDRSAVLEDGDSFGEIALLEKIPRTRSVRAMKKTFLLALSRDYFEKEVIPSLGASKIQEILQKRAFLSRLPLCRNWHPQALQRFAAYSIINTYAPQAVALRKGDNNQFFHIVYEGVFAVERKGKTLANLKTGEFFGEISLLQNSVSTADVIARGECKSLAVHKKEFLRFIGEDFFLGLQFERISSKRLHRPIFPLPKRSFEAYAVY